VAAGLVEALDLQRDLDDVRVAVPVTVGVLPDRVGVEPGLHQDLRRHVVGPLGHRRDGVQVVRLADGLGLNLDAIDGLSGSSLGMVEVTRLVPTVLRHHSTGAHEEEPCRDDDHDKCP